jgi:hypothetical protein
MSGPVVHTDAGAAPVGKVVEKRGVPKSGGPLYPDGTSARDGRGAQISTPSRPSNVRPPPGHLVPVQRYLVSCRGTLWWPCRRRPCRRDRILRRASWPASASAAQRSAVRARRTTPSVISRRRGWPQPLKSVTWDDKAPGADHWGNETCLPGLRSVRPKKHKSENAPPPTTPSSSMLNSLTSLFRSIMAFPSLSWPRQFPPGARVDRSVAGSRDVDHPAITRRRRHRAAARACFLESPLLIDSPVLGRVPICVSSV